MTTETKKVPDARLPITGRSFGGAYYHEAEFEIVLVDDGDTALASLIDSQGTVLDSRELTADQARLLIETVQRPSPNTLVPGLEVLPMWTFGGIDNYAELKEFDTVTSWLAHWLGDETWDWSESKEWY